MYFSFLGERKVPKESPLKESTQVLSLRILSPVLRALFALRQKGQCAVTSRLTVSPQPRRSAELAGLAYSRGCERSFLVAVRASGLFRADGAPPFVRGIGCPRPSALSASCAPCGRRGRAPDGGLRKGGPSLTWRSFGTFLSTEREKYVDHSRRKLQLEAITQKTKGQVAWWHTCPFMG